LIGRWFSMVGGKGLMTICLLLLASVVNAQQKQTISVLASIKPLQLIAQALTHDVTSAQVLLPAGVTPHDYALKPSDLKKVYGADVLLWLGAEIEPYLAKPVKMHEGAQLAAWQLSEKKESEHPGEHDGHHHVYGDPHIWFGPQEAERVARKLAQMLMAQDQGNAQHYQQNLTDFLRRLAVTDTQIKAQLAAQMPNYLVAHDAYSYFEKHYGLQHVGVISGNPEAKPGAKSLLMLRKTIVEEQVKCLFMEPQTDPRIVSILTEGHTMQVYTLDPMATDIELSKTGYETFLQTAANRFAQCH
jgi:zinc transport system substrate-binding protein